MSEKQDMSLLSACFDNPSFFNLMSFLQLSAFPVRIFHREPIQKHQKNINSKAEEACLLSICGLSTCVPVDFVLVDKAPGAAGNETRLDGSTPPWFRPPTPLSWQQPPSKDHTPVLLVPQGFLRGTERRVCDPSQTIRTFFPGTLHLSKTV